MDEFGCDYKCRTVGESIAQYRIPDDWCAEFDAYDGAYPVVCVGIDQIRRNPAMMALKVRIARNGEYAGCVILSERRIVAYKIDCMSDLLKAMEE